MTGNCQSLCVAAGKFNESSLIQVNRANSATNLPIENHLVWCAYLGAVLCCMAFCGCL